MLGAINQQHSAEGVAPISLPSNFASESPQTQLLQIANAERASRGYATFGGLESDLNSLAQVGAQNNTDPNVKKGSMGNVGWGANWAGGQGNALEADYDWMYDDGPGSGNIDCSKPGASGCWGHRNNILTNYGKDPRMGAGYVGGSSPSYTQLFMTQPVS